MSIDQLYYPNIEPSLNEKLAISFLHWDRVLRILPKKGTANIKPSFGVLQEFEEEKILVSEFLRMRDIDYASLWLDKLIEVVEGPPGPSKFELELLIRPRPKVFGKKGYFIYKGKTDYSFSKEYPKYFQKGRDRDGNVIYNCSLETGLTYMTLLAYFVCKRTGCKNTITDIGNSFPLFITLNKYFNFSRFKVAKFVPHLKAAKEVERIFYTPLLKLLKPKNFADHNTVSKILDFRKDPENDKLRKRYLQIIDNFLNDLYKCNNDEQAKIVTHDHEKRFNNHLKILVEACKSKGIPVNSKIVSYGRSSNWEIVGKLYDKGCTIKNIVTLNALSLVKPLLKLKPSLDFYNEIIAKSEHYFPLLIQETFAPNHIQKMYQKINQMDKTNFN